MSHNVHVTIQTCSMCHTICMSQYKSVKCVKQWACQSSGLLHLVQNVHDTVQACYRHHTMCMTQYRTVTSFTMWMSGLSHVSHNRMSQYRPVTWYTTCMSQYRPVTWLTMCMSQYKPVTCHACQSAGWSQVL